MMVVKQQIQQNFGVQKNVNRVKFIRLMTEYRLGTVCTPQKSVRQLTNKEDSKSTACSRGGNSQQRTAANIRTFTPYLFSQQSVGQSAVTDRFIPSRKLLQHDSFLSAQEPNDQNENRPESSVSMSDLYRKCLLGENKGGEQHSIQNYENKNLLRYNLHSGDSSGAKENERIVIDTAKRRKISKLPCKVLDAPALQDDYYLNLIDWSTQNFLAVGLASSVYMWNAQNSRVTKLCDLGISDSATSVSWSPKGPNFALGTNNGQVQIWDVNKMKKTRVFLGHTNRVGAISWNSTILSTGSRDKTILHRDLRCQEEYTDKLIGHKQEICGLKWSFDEQQLCSGGNDNKLLVWNTHSNEPILKYNDHIAAVKAMTWSPHQHGLLVSGGGTADRTIRFRNTLTGTTIKTVDVGSQVCNLMFSKTLNEIVSTHGFSHHQINIWKYPRMEKICTLTGHTYRVLYLAMSPDGSTIVTGAGDQTLRFWNIFPSVNDNGKKAVSQLNSSALELR